MIGKRKEREAETEAPEGGEGGAEAVPGPRRVLLSIGLGRDGDEPRVTVTLTSGEAQMTTAFLRPETARVFAAQMETMARVAEEEAK